jgi:hypothetical protein
VSPRATGILGSRREPASAARAPSSGVVRPDASPPRTSDTSPSIAARAFGSRSRSPWSRLPATPVKGVCGSSRLEVPSTSLAPPFRSRRSLASPRSPSLDLAVELAAPSARRAAPGASAASFAPGISPEPERAQPKLDTAPTARARSLQCQPTHESVYAPRAPVAFHPPRRAGRTGLRRPDGLPESSRHPRTAPCSRLYRQSGGPRRTEVTTRPVSLRPEGRLRRPASPSPPSRRDPASFVAPGRARRLGRPPPLSPRPRPSSRSHLRRGERVPSTGCLPPTP